MSDQANIGVTGLAVMGRNLARNLARHGHTVALHNRHPQRTQELVERFGDEGSFVPTTSAAESSRGPSTLSSKSRRFSNLTT